jgi:hypothetical protein
VSDWKREILKAWAFALAYTAYVAGEGAACLALLGDWGAVLALVLALGPLIAWSLKEPS